MNEATILLVVESEATAVFPTPDGWKTIGTLAAGDKLFDEAGQVCNVLVADSLDVPQRRYRLFFDDGSHIDACSEHQWLTFNERERIALLRRTPEFRERRRKTRPSRVKGTKSALFTERLIAWNKANPPPTKPAPAGTVHSTEEIFNSLRGHDQRPNHAIPVAQALETPYCDLPINPYTLGAWLGDGHSSWAIITIGDDSTEIVEKIGEAGYEVVSHKRTPNRNALPYGIHGLHRLLRLNGLLNNKHIPTLYLRAGFDQRLELLKGVMDTDGGVDRDGHTIFYNTNKTLIDDVLELLRTLGLKARVNEKPAKLYGKDCGLQYQITFKANFPVFHLARKQEKQKLEGGPATGKRAQFYYVTDCQPIEPAPMWYITVSSPSSTYLTGKSFVPMHDSSL